MKFTILLLLVLTSLYSNSIKSLYRSGDTLVFEFNLPQYSLEDVKGYTLIISDGLPASTMDKGFPKLPFTHFTIENSGEVLVEIVNANYKKIAVKNILTSRGNISLAEKNSAPIPPLSNNRYPFDRVNISKPFNMHGLEGTTISIYPFQYFQDSIEILTTAEIRVVQKSQPPMVRSLSSGSNIFSSLKDELFIAQSTPPQLFRQALRSYTPDRMVIITPPHYRDAIEPLRIWKEQRGLEVVTAIYGECTNIGEAGISDYLKNLYSEERFSYILLVGSHSDIPSPIRQFMTNGQLEIVPADPLYGMLEGDDLVPDAFTGRILANSVDEVVMAVDRVINYEKNLSNSDTWLMNSLAIASEEGWPKSDIDWMRDSINAPLKNSGYKVVELFEPEATAEKAVEFINSGVGLVNYMGHGAERDIYFLDYSFYFEEDHIRDLTNSAQLPIWIPLACNIGKFTVENSFSELLFTSPNGGAIALMGSSPLMDWTPPLTAQTEMNRLISSGNINSLGAIFYGGITKMILRHERDHRKTASTWNFFGDPSLSIFTSLPQKLDVKHPATYKSSDELAVFIKSGALITLFDPKLGVTVARELSLNGTLQIPFNTNSDTLILTATKANHQPYQATLYRSTESMPFAFMRSNFDDTVKNGETISLAWTRNSDEPLSIYLYKDDEKISTISENNSDNSFDWVVSSSREGLHQLYLVGKDHKDSLSININPQNSRAIVIDKNSGEIRLTLLKSEKITIDLYNIRGQRVWRDSKLFEDGLHRLVFPTNLSKQVYILQINSENGALLNQILQFQ